MTREEIKRRAAIRRKEIIEGLQRGLTMQIVGDVLGISRQRIHQLVNIARERGEYHG